MSEQLESQDTGEQVQEASAEDRLPELENDQQEEQAATHEETKPEGEAKPDDQSTKTVPLAALHESRRKEREARDQLRQWTNVSESASNACSSSWSLRSADSSRCLLSTKTRQTT